MFRSSYGVQILQDNLPSISNFENGHFGLLMFYTIIYTGLEPGVSV